MSLLDALKAATADVESEPKKANTDSTDKTDKPAAKATPKTGNVAQKAQKAQKGGEAKATPKTNKPKNFSYLFNDYLRSALKQALDERAASDEVLAKKMQAKDKSFEDCMNYIGEHFYQLALKQRNGKSCVSFGGNGEELVGLAVHYYDETNEDLKKELKSK